MSKKLTYVELDAERARLAKSERLLGIALNLTLHGKPDATEQVSHEGDQWKLQLYGARCADAGIVVETFYHPGQSAHSAVHYLDDLSQIPARLSDGGMKYTEALSRLRSARDRIVSESERSTQALKTVPESSVQKAAQRYSIRLDDGSGLGVKMLADGLTIDQVEQWWKENDASGARNEDRYEGLRTEGNIVLVTAARQWRAEDGRGAADDEQSPGEDMGR
jgi:hypothetical protein